MGRKISKSHVEYKEQFDQIMDSNTPILNKYKEPLILEPDEVFRQCYVPNSIRDCFPRYYFLSNKGNLVSLAGKEPKWLKKNKNQQDGREFYIFRTPEGNQDTLPIYDMIGLVFLDEVDAFGQAKKELGEKGRYAIGKFDNPFACNINHKNSVKEHPELAYEPKNLQWVTTRVHKPLIDGAPKHDADIEEIINYTKKLVETMEKESPHKINSIFAGEKFNTSTGEWSSAEQYAHASEPEPVDASDVVETLKEHPFITYVPVNEECTQYALLYIEATEDGMITGTFITDVDDNLKIVEVKEKGKK